MITTATPVTNFGFSPVGALKSVARGAARVVTNPNVQRAAAAGAQAYAPGQYAAAQQYADRARGIFQPPQQQAQPVPMPMPQMMPEMPDGPPQAQHGNIMVFGLIGVGLLALLLMSK